MVTDTVGVIDTVGEIVLVRDIVSEGDLVVVVVSVGEDDTVVVSVALSETVGESDGVRDILAHMQGEGNSSIAVAIAMRRCSDGWEALGRDGKGRVQVKTGLCRLSARVISGRGSPAPLRGCIRYTEMLVRKRKSGLEGDFGKRRCQR